MPGRPLHLRLSALALVFFGGLLGTAARYLVEELHAFEPPEWPWATFFINLAGAFVLGIVLEALSHLGPDTGWRRRTRLLAGTGFCGAFTTYSAFALETSLLVRDGAVATAIGYVVATVVLGALAAWAGIAAAAAFRTPTVPPR